SRRHDAHRRAARDDLGDLGGACAQQRTARAPAFVDDEARAELYDERTLHRCCVPSPTTRYWRRYRSRYVTGPRGPGTRSTLMPVSGAPVSAKPSVKRVGAFQYAAVPRYASRNCCAADGSSVTIVAARPDVSPFAIATASSSDATVFTVTDAMRSGSFAHSWPMRSG